MELVFPDTTPYKNEPEMVFIFSYEARRVVRLASNCYYEVYGDNDFIGTGGQRCIKGEVYIDTWDVSSYTLMSIRVHWLNIPVSYRSVFENSFITDLDVPTSNYICTIASIGFKARICNQLASQNWLYKSIESVDKIPLCLVTDYWELLPSTTLNTIRVDPIQIASGTTQGSHPKDVLDLTSTSAVQRLAYTTFDLGYIAHHHIALQAGQWVIAYYSEVPKFEDKWATGNRRKVKMADGFTGGDGHVIGLRGCRYVHLVYPINQSANVRAWRIEYPFIWIDYPSTKLYQAVRNNLMACVDGGLIDTCWRERAQWVGDIRMSAKALLKMTKNTDIIHRVIHQIADSYDSKAGMVQGIWPYKEPKINKHNGLYMPTYHLAFCITALENNIKHKIVYKSLHQWRNNYVREGIISSTIAHSWDFIDWDFEDSRVMGRDIRGTNAVINIWYQEACHLANIDSGIDMVKFDRLFNTGSGYRLMTKDKVSNIHATAAVLSSGYGDKTAFNWLKKQAFNPIIKTRVTAYYAYFIVKALSLFHMKTAIDFIDFYYLPIANKYGTIYEKCDDRSSMAHGWSIGFIEFL